MSYNLRGREARPNRMEIRLSDAELEALNRLCLIQDRTASFVLRKALSEYLNTNRAYDERSDVPGTA